MLSDQSPGLYVHVPFCSGKCIYCDFYSLNASSLMGIWLEGLIREAELYGPEWPPFETLYLGGGTPSRLPIEDLTSVVGWLRRYLDLSRVLEATVEVNPEDVSREWIEAALSLGLNRISLGIQSFSDHYLNWLGRRQTSAQNLTAIEIIRA
ncbi:MAG: radical SAM protein, partial [Deltaproteobacteria bacterium]|nr:radical SAM protein [Deltaproteobacteria bacterium]